MASTPSAAPSRRALGPRLLRAPGALLLALAPAWLTAAGACARDIGVLRLLGFKRWQVMVSFLLESLTVALVGGFIGCVLVRLFVNGAGSTSTLSGGGGGPGGKTVAITLDVNFEVVTMGMLFALAMGRIGGLVPALSAMRMKILDSLR